MWRTTWCILVALGALGALWGSPARAALAGTSSRSANKSDEFVNIIKDDLRRNNDDYEMTEDRSQAHPAPPAPAAPLSPSAPPTTPPVPLPPRNRVLPHSVAQPPARMRPSFAQPGPPSQPPRQAGRLLNQLGPARRLLEPGRSLNSSTRHATEAPARARPTLSRHLGINKLKRLLNERASINSSPQPKTSPSPPPSPPSRPPATPPSPSADVIATTEKRPAATPRSTSHTARSTQQEPVMRQKADVLTSSPTPDELDMAPARGSQIQHIRYKGRLCQRNLMNMEGPSYDKLGNEVNPPHLPSNSRGRRFYQTRPPKLLLPRCCNCCKKSVLGCQ